MAASNNPAKPVHILFVGAGAVGCFYASRLHHPSQNVYASLIARSNYKAIIAAGGKVELQTHSFGNYTFAPYAVFPNIEAAVPSASSSSSSPEAAVGGEKNAGSTGTPPSEGWDYIIVTTKALPDRTDDAAMVAPLVSEKSCLVLIQNGVGVEAPYRARFPRNPIVSAVTVISAEQIRNGVVRQNRWTRISLGPYGHGLGAPPGVGDQAGEEVVARLGDERMRALARWWTALGGIRDVETHTELELQTIRWHKLCINAAFNPTAVLSGGRGNADQLTDPELREHVLGIMHEIRDAAPLVLGKPFPDTLASPEKIVKSTERNTGGRPSMLLDWEAGRPMEIEVILGNPVRIARAKGVQMPRLQSLYACLRSMQRMREERAEKEKGKGKL